MPRFTASKTSHGLQALVLELVEGPTLADRIALGPIPVEEALPIARQIAEALEAAHEQGIVHRDLKPANVKLRPDGTVKVLDFGLAKTLEPDGRCGGDATASPTITSPAMTAMGMILGTAAYMSPEQAKGRQADKRSDVWAFGAVLYEMLSGQRAFKGDDVSDTLAAVLRQDVDWTALPASTPAPVRRLIARCLDRDVKRRLRDIGEARIVLDDPATLTSANARDADASAACRDRCGGARCQPYSPQSWSAGWLGPPRGTSSPRRRSLSRDSSSRCRTGQSFTGLARRMVDISPDGAQMVYVANGRLVSAIDVGTGRDGDSGHRRLSGREQSCLFTGWSLDRFPRNLRSDAQEDCRRPAVRPSRFAQPRIPFGMSWGADGIVFAEGSKGIRRVSPSGGTPDVLVSLKDGEVSESPQMLPGGRYLLFTLATGTAPNRWDTAHIVAQSIATGERKIIIQGGADARYVPTGHLVYAVGGSVVRRRIRREASGGDGQSRAGGRRRHASLGGQRRGKLQPLRQRHACLHPWHDLVIGGSDSRSP